jgi:hypothetical protein
MEDLAAQINAPLMESMVIELSYEEVPDFSELAKFVCRADKLSLIDIVEVTFQTHYISIRLSQKSLAGVSPKTLRLNLECPESDLLLSYLARFCASCLPNLTLFESLHICVGFFSIWDDVGVDPDSRWLELLRLSNPVKGLYLSKFVAPHVTKALRGLPAERVMDVLPALEGVFHNRDRILGTCEGVDF